MPENGGKMAKHNKRTSIFWFKSRLDLANVNIDQYILEQPLELILEF